MLQLQQLIVDKLDETTMYELAVRLHCEVLAKSIKTWSLITSLILSLLMKTPILILLIINAPNQVRKSRYAYGQI